MFLYYTLPEAISLSTCDKIIEAGLNQGLNPASVGSGNLDVRFDKRERISNISWINDEELRKEIYSLGLDINKEGFGFDLYPFEAQEPLQFTQYDGKEQGGYNWHLDTGFTHNIYSRKLSMTIQLSDPEDYEGGLFEILTDSTPQTLDQEELKLKGTAIVFPSFLLHRVTPVTKGNRYSLVSWLQGPIFR
jgi:PKHD-type hydroxylase